MLGELERAQELAKSVEQTAADMKKQFEAGEDELSALREKLNLAENRIVHLEGEKDKQSEVVAKQDAKLAVAKGASVRRASLSEGLLGVLMKVRKCPPSEGVFFVNSRTTDGVPPPTPISAVSRAHSTLI